MTLHSGIRQLATELRGAFTGTALIPQPLSKGEAREQAVVRILRPHIPSRFALSSGFVIDPSGRQSLQQDVVIADCFHGSPFVAEGHIGVHPTELVAGTLQVKSKLDRTSLADAIRNVASAKRLVPKLRRSSAIVIEDTVTVEHVQHATFGGILAFKAPIGSMGWIPEAFTDECLALPSSERPDALLVLDQYAVTWGGDPKSGPVIGVSAGDAHCCVANEAGQDSLLFFYINLMQRLHSFAVPPIDYNAYVAQAHLTYNWKAFRPANIE